MPVLFFDATGSVIVEVKNQKRVFLYSLVCHDMSNNSIMPIADFVTSAHDTITIAKYLLSIKTNLDDINRVSIVVTDFSWALMNAVILIFNSCNISKYLEMCFDFIFGHGICTSNIKTVLMNCSCHTLKNVVRKSKKVNCDADVRRAFIFCFGLLLNSLTYKQFEVYLLNIFNMFHQKYETESLIYSFNFLKNEIKIREINQHTDPDVFEKPEYLEKKKNLNQLSDDREFNVETLGSLKGNSPFKIYFNNVLDAYELNVANDNELFSTVASNKFYCPELFDIVKSMLYAVPFWSGLMLSGKVELNGMTRLDNNKVENWFGDLKVNKLKNKQVMPSELAGLLYKRVQAKYFQFYSDLDKKEPKLNNDAICKQEENWKSKQKKHFNKEKGFYYKKIENFGMCEEKIENGSIDKKFTNFSFDEAFRLQLGKSFIQ